MVMDFAHQIPAQKPIAEGKTKKLYDIGGGYVSVVSKDDITAGDGAKHDVLAGKNVLATTTTCNIFKLLDASGIPLAYVQRLTDESFQAHVCRMLPYEVVVRRVGLGSYPKRNPHVPANVRLGTLVVEFFLKTSGKQFRGISIPKDDPFISAYTTEGVTICRPDEPVRPDTPTITIPAPLVYGRERGVRHPFKEMERLVRQVFLVLEKAWDMQQCTLCDLKVEFGFKLDGTLLVADVIDNDSWRVFNEKGEHLDKQRYRDGATLVEILALYKEVAHRTEAFASLAKTKPTIVLWRASPSDPIAPFTSAMTDLTGSGITLEDCVGSVHKKPERCLWVLREILAKPGPKVLITYVGRSNGAGPVFAADTHIPVIAVPVSVKEFPEDVWSSLRMPSNVPLMTVLDPANAVLAALGILAETSPAAYMARRMVVEDAKLDPTNSPSYGKSW